MPLSVRLAFHFDKRVQIKGASLFAGRRVRVNDSGPAFLCAMVRGGDNYHVHLQYAEEAIGAFCECAYFNDFGPCKHLWAAVLEADRLGAITDAASARTLRVVPNLDLEDDEYADSDPFEDGEEEQDTPEEWLRRRNLGFGGRIHVPPKPQIPIWQERLTSIQNVLRAKDPNAPNWPRSFELDYVIDPIQSRSAGSLVVALFSRARRKNGTMGDPKELRVTPPQASLLPEPADAEIVSAILGGQEYTSYGYYGYSSGSTRKSMPVPLALKLLPAMSATGRLFSAGSGNDHKRMDWDPGDPWTLWLDIRQDERDQWAITGSLRRGEQRMTLKEPSLVINGFLIAKGKLSRFDAGGNFQWVTQLRDLDHIPFPDRERDSALAKLLESPMLPPLDIDGPLRFEERRAEPRLGFRIVQRPARHGEESFEGHLILDYGRGWTEQQSGRGMWIPEERVYVVRDLAAEESANNTLHDLGVRPVDGRNGTWNVTAKTLPRIARELLQAGWRVEAEGKAFRRPGNARVDVKSGIDWFELHAEVDYGDVTATLPQLLAALRRGDTMVRLGDGSFGLLPEEWLERFAPIAGLGTEEEEHLRFKRNQAGILDALLAAQPEVQFDELFQRVRERLREFKGVGALAQPEGFTGQLREYQREGLGWMQFLRDFGFGGCLADDMGVGKTAQVLGMLEERRAQGCGTSLVVAPKSLMFNWRAEAAKFTPNLRVLEHTGTARDLALIPKNHLVLTTYGTMLRDIVRLSEIEFDYVVLDEAQAVKNAATASAKAVRLLHGKHRLALSGTPVENHLGELWSLFEFLNPGMLGEAKVLKMAGGLARNPGEEARVMLGQALRPFILRRTKQQVASELPSKTEQTIYCELEGPQRKHYDELRRHYRESLLKRVQTEGLAKSKIQVLEALLRLRQAACHPGLLDAKHMADGSAKLDTLFDQLAELREEGHKALVFSQFTSLLGIVRHRLDAEEIPYEYLDGQTRDRQARVEAFQNDPNCGLFLISLKAGGLGLNLTAAEYVFLLDPWWNPAVEAQAIDRTHRIGQTRPVFAYRLIARDTVEEKVLELQKTKRDLVNAILGEDNSLIRDLKREDLELLLS